MANYTILLIDYEPRSIERFRQPLTDAGYTVEVATDGITGIEAFHRLSPDMVLVEAMIPKKHGFEVCQELKRTPHGRKTPILITTGVYKGRKYRTQALHIYGCDEYIEKPIAPEQLLGVVGKFFGPGAATATAAATESRPAAAAQTSVIAVSEGAARLSVPVSASHEPPQAPPARPKPATGSVVKDFTEEEIMARLDAILPGGDLASVSAAAASPEMTIAAPPPMMAAPVPLEVSEVQPLEVSDFDPMDEVHEITEVSQEVSSDPFAQMQAELTAELGSISAALAREPAPVFESDESPIRSDQVVSPSVLEALPSPELEPTIATIPVAPATPEPEMPGQLVSFDAKRSRRNKKSGKKNQSREQASEQEGSSAAAPAARTLPSMSTAGSKVVTTPLALPTGTLAESDLGVMPVKKRLPVWIWLALAVAAAIAVYFVVIRPRMEASQQSQAPSSEPVRRASVPKDPPAATRGPAGSDASSFVLNSVDGQALRPASPDTAPTPASSPAKTEPANAAPVQKPGPSATSSGTSVGAFGQPPLKKSEFIAPKPIGKTLAVDKSTPSVPQAPPSAGVEEGVADVATIAEPTVPVAAPTIAPGTLVDAGEVDTAPVSLSRKLPVYSMQARHLRLQGTVVMRVLVNEQGTVDDVVLVEGVNGADLNNAAMRAAKSWTYRPATKNGVPVKVWKTEQIVFKI
jgi:TonB family protein